ncbi:putative IMPACT [Besnoitia besnoiti]|uniref:Putative IMPACT n=1 Tax=Besnoitia besnoiti TaxID=94643 RepID=A0A2A9MFP5_BESBE|nr:putative IMPACT [Besnoitia besnoiti]PFH34202.1 putative IMPACT [Besnoitia besnoiti]
MASADSAYSAAPSPFPPCECPAAATQTSSSSAAAALSAAAEEELEALKAIYGEEAVRFHSCCRLVQVQTETTRSRVQQGSSSLLGLHCGRDCDEAAGDEDDETSFWFLVQLFLPAGFLEPDFVAPVCVVNTPWEQDRAASLRMQNELLALQGDGEQKASVGHPGLFDFVECVRSCLPLPPCPSRSDEQDCVERLEGAFEAEVKRDDASQGAASNGRAATEPPSPEADTASAARREAASPSAFAGVGTALYTGPTVTVHKSRFVGVCATVYSLDGVRALYRHVREMHYGATHVIMAFSIRQRRPRVASKRRERCQARPAPSAEDASRDQACISSAKTRDGERSRTEACSGARAPPEWNDAPSCTRFKRNKGKEREKKPAEKEKATEAEVDEEEFIDNCDHDSDGETGAGRKLQQLLYNLKARNVFLVVTRWYGGVLLGPDRFRIIASVGRQALDASGVLEPAVLDGVKRESHKKKISGFRA